jgi:substrate-binding family protein
MRSPILGLRVTGALEGAGIAYDASLVRAGRWAPNASSTAGANESSGYQLTHELMTLGQPPDGIFCAADSLAAGALDALHELRIKVPQEVRVVGFDNRSFAAHQRPPLTTIAASPTRHGQASWRALSNFHWRQCYRAVHTSGGMSPSGTSVKEKRNVCLTDQLTRCAGCTAMCRGQYLCTSRTSAFQHFSKSTLVLGDLRQ